MSAVTFSPAVTSRPPPRLTHCKSAVTWSGSRSVTLARITTSTHASWAAVSSAGLRYVGLMREPASSAGFSAARRKNVSSRCGTDRGAPLTTSTWTRRRKSMTNGRWLSPFSASGGNSTTPVAGPALARRIVKSFRPIWRGGIRTIPLAVLPPRRTVTTSSKVWGRSLEISTPTRTSRPEPPASGSAVTLSRAMLPGERSGLTSRSVTRGARSSDQGRPMPSHSVACRSVSSTTSRSGWPEATRICSASRSAPAMSPRPQDGGIDPIASARTSRS